MEDHLFEAHEELKRLEHIIYVTLKYTRTVDVLVNALQRLVDIYDLIINSYLLKAKQEGLITAIPKSPGLCSTTLSGLHPQDEKLQKYLTFYVFLKTILNKPRKKREEFRRHVTLVVELDNATAEVHIDNLVNCERFIHQFFRYAMKQVLGKSDEEE